PTAAAPSTDVPTAPPPPPPATPAPPPIAASPATSAPGVTFLPPLGAQPTGSLGSLDEAAHQFLAVEICEWTGTSCNGPLVRRFIAPDALRIVSSDFGEAYQATWQVKG